ncbi:16S rRNA (cytosine(1402)-N(4))-methyltransferase RsmH [Fodinicurvata sp. EGI_FJ10296]|uniref:16S rRNA (cytosine(1402)-N(4))-methyltransferase RsmH n=1 Tax=Fodinicurvata sp. EGI_FJ10296 TaxID=3231908 RepID=UPI0034544898
MTDTSQLENARPPHTPVMIDQVLAALDLQPGTVVVDATYGRGGYTTRFLQAADCRVIAVDRDPEAIAHARTAAESLAGRLTPIQACFGDLASVIDSVVGGPVDAIAMDLGVSSPQLDDARRGFSFRYDGPLDMRMGTTGPTAADLVNTLDEADLAAIIRDLGEERHARRVARTIVERRRETPFSTTADLGNVIRSVVRRARDGIDPATRTFQALRLQVNDELGELDRGLVAAEKLLRPGGRLAVVSFHSLEDRRVKHFLADRSGRRAGGSRHMPAASDAFETKAPTFELITRKALIPSEAEQKSNPRARSARMRAALRTSAPAWSDSHSGEAA